MNIDIRTLFIALSVVLVINALISTQAWRYAKSMKLILGYWCLSQILIAIGLTMVSFRNIIPDFLSIIIANTCIAGGQIAAQEGIARYMNKDGYLRKATLIALLLQTLLFLYYTYITPAVISRIVLYSLVAIVISVISISTLRKSDTVMNAPRKFLLGVLVFHVCLMFFRGTSAIVEGNYTHFMNSGQIQALGLVGALCFYLSFHLGFFWLILQELSLEVQRQAFIDSLTNIPNRRALDEFMENLMPSKINCNIALLFIDVDKFKNINDQYGHQAGDLYLIQLCHLLNRDLRHGDTVYRYAGDEFVVVMQNINTAKVQQRAELLRQKSENLSIDWNGQIFSTTVSIGLAIANPQLNNWDDLLRIADEALYIAKRSGGNNVVLG